MKTLLNKHTLFLFTVPAFVLYTIFFISPMFNGLYYSLTDWDGFSKDYDFVGLSNFIEVMKDEQIRNSLTFTTRYTVLLVFFTVIISLFLALLLNSKIRLRTFFRSVYFFPAVLSLLTVGLIFNQIFYQVLPFMGKGLNIEFLSVNILASPTLAQFGILSVNIWQGVSIPTILFIAALQSVPAELIEAAKIDGATAVQRFRNVVIPYLIPVMNIIIIITLKNGLTLFDYVKAMTDGGPGRATESIGILIYNYAFEELKFSYGITVSIVLFFIMGGISIIQLKWSSKFEVK
ncbi:carbohydrate ABC transporter permease [Cohnella sp. CFH 77786]|uniref:carbohydrate ABC transporter permease n=1 Tax=Cohnella sp. CFH 77786 TaxID=2662265 RepID=UPI00351D03C7